MITYVDIIAAAAVDADDVYIQMQQRERNSYCFDVDDGATYGGAATGVDIVVVEV